MIERPPNYESLTLTNSSAEFGNHSLSPPEKPKQQKLSQARLTAINRRLPKPIVEAPEEESSFVHSKYQSQKEPELKKEDPEPNPMDEEFPEPTLTSNASKTYEKRQMGENDNELIEELARTCFQGGNSFR